MLPQALTVIIPAAGNQLVGVLKASALVAAIGGGDLLTRVEELYGANYEVIPLLDRGHHLVSRARRRVLGVAASP